MTGRRLKDARPRRLDHLGVRGLPDIFEQCDGARIRQCVRVRHGRENRAHAFANRVVIRLLGREQHPVEILEKYGAENKVVKQLIDLALLANNMLRGEELNSFVKRSVELL